MSNEINFSDLSYDEQVKEVDDRIGDHPERIKSPYELLDIKGQTIYLVVSPFGKEQEIGNCFLLTWEVGDVIEHRGEPLTLDTPLMFDNDQKYICYSFSSPDHGLSLKDFNIVPNTYNNHAAFTSEDAAHAYVLYRKLQFAEDPSISGLEGDYAHWFTKEDIARLRRSEEEGK